MNARADRGVSAAEAARRRSPRTKPPAKQAMCESASSPSTHVSTDFQVDAARTHGVDGRLTFGEGTATIDFWKKSMCFSMSVIPTVHLRHDEDPVNARNFRRYKYNNSPCLSGACSSSPGVSSSFADGSRASTTKGRRLSSLAERPAFRASAMTMTNPRILSTRGASTAPAQVEREGTGADAFQQVGAVGGQCSYKHGDHRSLHFT